MGRRALTMTVAEAAGLLGISRTSAYECVRRGELRAVRLGRRLVVPCSVMDEILAGPVAMTNADATSHERGRVMSVVSRARARFVGSVGVLPDVVREWHRLACSASGTSGCELGLRRLQGPL